MRDFIIGFVLGMIFSAGLAYAAMSSSLVDREFSKFIETASGDTAILAVIVE